MRDVYSFGGGFFLLSLLFVVNFCNADDQTTFEVVGIGECADCKENNFKTSHVFLGLHVTIDCKLKTGEIKRVGAGELDKQGKFKISLPHEIIVQNGQKLKEDCYAKLHSSSALPCPARHDGLEAGKIIFRSQINKKSIFVPTKNLRFSYALCTTKFTWPYFKYPPLPKTHSNWKKKFPKINFPPLKNFLPPFSPLYKPKPLPPPIPIYKPPIVKPYVPIYKPKPKPPVVKPLPPTVPIYKLKPKPPVYKPPVVKPLPPPVPIYKLKPKPPVYKSPVVKPLPPHVPINKPKPSVYKPKPKPPVVTKPFPPPVPIYKPPIVTKPLPPPIPLFPLPPFYKKPCPPLPKIPKKYFHHPKFGYFPPLPPSIPHP